MNYKSFEPQGSVLRPLICYISECSLLFDMLVEFEDGGIIWNPGYDVHIANAESIQKLLVVSILLVVSRLVLDKYCLVRN